MTLPSAQTLYAVIEASWPPAAATQVGPWIIRDGAGGGQRVSAATARRPARAEELPIAENAMHQLGQPGLFMIRDGDDALDALLATRGYVIKDPVTMYAAPAATIATKRPPPVTCFEVWPPLAIQADIWSAGGIGPARLAVMDRAPHPKTTLLGRTDDQPAGSVYVGSHQGCAMIHALEIAPDHRLKGLARHLTRAAAFWALDNDLSMLTLVTTTANTGANALYTSLGMTVVGQYHYRIHPEA